MPKIVGMQKSSARMAGLSVSVVLIDRLMILKHIRYDCLFVALLNCSLFHFIVPFLYLFVQDASRICIHILAFNICFLVWRRQRVVKNSLHMNRFLNRKILWYVAYHSLSLLMITLNQDLGLILFISVVEKCLSNLSIYARRV